MTENNNVTTDAIGRPTARPTSKVVAATGGATLGGAITVIAVYAFETTTRIDLPGPVEAAIATVVATVVAFAAGYLKRPGSAR